MDIEIMSEILSSFGGGENDIIWRESFEVSHDFSGGLCSEL